MCSIIVVVYWREMASVAITRDLRRIEGDRDPAWGCINIAVVGI